MRQRDEKKSTKEKKKSTGGAGERREVYNFQIVLNHWPGTATAIQKYERNITEGSQQRQRQRQWQGREAIYDACVWRNEYEKKKLMARLGFYTYTNRCRESARRGVEG